MRTTLTHAFLTGDMRELRLGLEYLGARHQPGLFCPLHSRSVLRRGSRVSPLARFERERAGPYLFVTEGTIALMTTTIGDAMLLLLDVAISWGTMFPILMKQGSKMTEVY
ncbi:MAG TPA: hypothetical protein PKD54_13580 [Pirellulaceae bacterium]|nr:hypothetical protein [Pirellulaceae bacterium]